MQRLEGWLVAVRKEIPGLFLQPFLHHFEHACVYARVQFLAGALETDLLDFEIPVLETPGLEGGEGLAGVQAHLQRADDALSVGEVDLVVGHGIQFLELVRQDFHAFVAEAFHQVLAEHHRHLGEVVQSVAEGVDVQHGAAGDDQGFMAFGEKPVDERERIGLVHAGGVVLGDG